MKVGNIFRWCFLFPSVSVAMPGVWRRQAQTSSDTCTCPANGPTTTIVSQYTIVTSYSTVTTQSGTVYSTGLASAPVVTVISSATVTVIGDTSTIVAPGVTTTATTLSTATSTITTTITSISCTVLPKVKRQNSATTAPTSISTILSTGSRSYTCFCRLISTSSGLAGTSSSTCSCPATTGTTITSTTGITTTTTVLVVSAIPTTIAVAPSATSTSTILVTVTSSSLATTETTQSAVTVTSQSIVTVTVTSTSTAFSCPSSSSSISSTGTRTSSTTARSTATGLAVGEALVCNSTAYLIATTDDIPKLYNINLRTSEFFAINTNVGEGKYTNINGMGYSVLDNYLYATGELKSSSTSYAILRISSTGYTEEIGSFDSTSSTFPASSGDVDTSGRYWIAGSGGTTWRQVDVVPGSSTYGQTIDSGTATLTGYDVYDWVYLPGNGSYLYSLASTTSSPANLVTLRWSISTHEWSVYQAYTDRSQSDSIIANWASDNGTIWGMASTTGVTSRVILGGTPVEIGSAPSGLTSADGGRCVLSP